MKHLRVTRHLNKQIEITIENGEFDIRMSLSDFLSALSHEAGEPLVRAVAQAAGSPSLWFTGDKLEAKLVEAFRSVDTPALLNAASERIVTDMKSSILST